MNTNKHTQAVKALKSFNHWREWVIDEIRVQIIDDKTAWIDYEKYMVNSPRNRIVVTVNWFERRKGITLQTKVTQKLSQLKINLQQENEQIIAQKELERKLNIKY
jgi:hypothetical protein